MRDLKVKDLRKKIKELESSEERSIKSRILFEEAAYPIILFDAETTKMIEFNKSAYENLGYTKEEFSGFSLIDIDPVSSIEGINQLFREILNTGAKVFESKFKAKNGEVGHFQISAKRITILNKDHILAVIRDFTEQTQNGIKVKKESEKLEEIAEMRTSEIGDQVEKLNKSQRAMLFMIEDLNRTSIMLKNAQDELLLKERLAILGQFSGSISHELRNPLSVIDSSAYFLRSVLNNPDEKIKEHLDRIKNGVKISTSIIESLLNLTRMKKPKMEKNDIQELTDKTISEIKLPDNIKLKTLFNAKNRIVNCEPLQIKIALKNIIKNGIESMENGGNLLISGENDKQGMIILKFKDSGVGIKKDNIIKIFEPLFTLKAKGIGFGLPITKMIIENHKGQINVQSVLGEGTEFIIGLPVLKNQD